MDLSLNEKIVPRTPTSGDPLLPVRGDVGSGPKRRDNCTKIKRVLNEKFLENLKDPILGPDFFSDVYFTMPTERGTNVDTRD